MVKLMTHYKRFKEFGNKYRVKTTIGMYVDSLWIRIKYSIGSKEYFENRLYDKSTSHLDYYATVHYVIHKWKTVSHKFMPDCPFWKKAIYYLDYRISQIIYPGLDAMDYFRYDFYNYRYAKRKTFITEGAMKKMDKRFNGSSGCYEINERLSNKYEFNRMFDDIVTREWIISDECSEQEFMTFCGDKSRIIVKPLCEGGGKGIYTVDIPDEVSKRRQYAELSKQHYIVEEIIVQHPSLACINPSSVNTVRVYTVADKNNEIYVTGATLRMGNGEGPTDNYSRGGLAAEIDIATGIVCSRAVSQNADNVIIHPYSGEIILGRKIPNWGEIQTMVKMAHQRVLPLRYIGWDVVVCADGEITFLEANTCAGVELQQHPALVGKKYIYKQYI